MIKQHNINEIVYCTPLYIAVALCGMLLPGVMLSTPVEAETLRIYNWSDYIDESLLVKFEQETGIKVIYDVFDSNEVLETKLLAGGTGYDVVVPSGSFMSRQIQAGIFQKLDKSKLTNLQNSWDYIQRLTDKFDPGNQHSINYMWGTTGIGYNVKKVTAILGKDAPVTSLSLIFDPENMKKLAACGVYFLDAPDEMIPIALSYLGENPNSKDMGVLKKAESVLAAVRPYVRKFHSSEYISALAGGNICVTFGWSGDILQARERAEEAENGIEIKYAIPSEGGQIWFDMMAIPADAPNPESAHRFLNFMLRSDIAAAASNHVYYANGNWASQALLNQEIINNRSIYPDIETMNNFYIKTGYKHKVQRFVNRMWTRIKSGL